MGWTVAHFSFSNSILSSRMPRARRRTGFDGGVDRFDVTAANDMVAVGGDTVDVLEEEIAQLLHLWEALPPQGLEPSHQEIKYARSGLVGPEPIELLAKHVGLEQPPVRREQGLELAALRSTHGLPAPQQQPPLAAAVLPHPGSRAKELLAADFVERRAGVLQHVKLVEDDVAVGTVAPTALR